MLQPNTWQEDRAGLSAILHLKRLGTPGLERVKVQVFDTPTPSRTRNSGLSSRYEAEEQLLRGPRGRAHFRWPERCFWLGCPSAWLLSSFEEGRGRAWGGGRICPGLIVGLGQRKIVLHVLRISGKVLWCVSNLRSRALSYALHVGEVDC